MDAAFFQTELISMGVALSELALKGTATMISAKMRSIKDEKNIDAVKNTYNEIVNELLQERDEAVRIAQTYKSELERVVISDEDIVHLHNTISTLIDIVKSTQLSSTAGREELGNEKTLKQIESYEKIKELISIDTLKTMQLLGFNYKAAIGEPLTKMCADALYAMLNKNVKNNNQNNRRR